jgi:NitT/TauT family transport system permease protein
LQSRIHINQKSATVLKFKEKTKLHRDPHFKKGSEKIKKRRESNAARLESIGYTVLSLSVFIGIWQLVFVLGIFPRVSLPSPASAILFTSIGMTMWRLIISFSISIILGVGVGLLMIKFRSFGKTMSSFALGLQSFPSIAWVPFAILLIGLNDFGIFFVVVMSSIFSVMLSTYSGISNIPTIYVRAAENMGATGLTLFRLVMLPAATPSLIIGVRQAWSFAWHALIGAEILIAASIGLGHILLVGREFQLMDQIIAAMITIFSIGFVFDRLIFYRLEDKVREKWGLKQGKEL